MSLITKVASIIDSKADLDKVAYLENKVNYDDEISILNVELTSILPPPPKNSSLATKRELEEIAKATKNRTRKELDLVYLVDNEPLDLFTSALVRRGMKFPKDIFDSYYNILEQYVYALKFYHNRARPEQLAPYFNLEIDVLYTETHHTPAYPSEHTMYAELAANILSDLYPELRKDFFQLSDYCGLARILQGVHYPSDNKAARIAVNKLYPLIKEIKDEKSENVSFDIKSKT